jgi:hypothetical protein
VNDGLTVFIMEDNKVDGKIFVNLQIFKIVFATTNDGLFSGVKSSHISLKAFGMNFKQVIFTVKQNHSTIWTVHKAFNQLF